MKVMTYLSCLAKMRSWRILLLVSLPDCKKEVNSDFFPFGGGGGEVVGFSVGWLVWFGFPCTSTFILLLYVLFCICRDAVVAVDRTISIEKDNFQPHKRSRLYGITTAFAQCPGGNPDDSQVFTAVQHLSI